MWSEDQTPCQVHFFCWLFYSLLRGPARRAPSPVMNGVITSPYKWPKILSDPGRGPPLRVRSTWKTCLTMRFCGNLLPQKKMALGPKTRKHGTHQMGLFRRKSSSTPKCLQGKKNDRQLKDTPRKMGCFFRVGPEISWPRSPKDVFIVKHVHRPKSHTQTKQNLRTLTPILEVRIPVAKTIWGNIANV